MRASNPKLADLDLDLILTPAATLRPGAAQRCIQRQVRPAWAAACRLVLRVGA